jgi:nucleotide-binding universal stress UspA family protein
MDIVVVGADETPGGAQAVQWAAKYAREHDASVVVVDALPGMWALSALQVDSTPIEREHAAEVRDIVCRPLVDAGVQFRTITQEGGTAEELLDAAQKTGADVIVIGHTIKKGLAEHVLGSTLHKLLTHAEVPVVVVPASEG